MTTATTQPLLALLGKGNAGPVAPAIGAVEDERALDAAIEFAALLLDAGAVDPEAAVAAEGGNSLPVDAGKDLPVVVQVPVKDAAVLDVLPGGETLQDAALADAETEAALAPMINRPGDDALVGNVTNEIRKSQAQPAVLQRPAGANPAAEASALTAIRGATPEDGADAGARAARVTAPADVAAVLASTPDTAQAEARAKALAAAEAARVAETNAMPVAARRAAARAAQQLVPAAKSAEGLRASTADPARLDALVGALTPLRDSVATGATTAAAVPKLAGPELMPGEGGWGRQFAERVGWVIQARLPQAQLTLNPEHLGPIDLAIEVEDAQARVQFTAAHAVTRDAIEQSLPRLRELLEQQGLELSQADVSTDSGTGSARRDAADAEPTDGLAARADDDNAAPDETPVSEPAVRLRARGLIDTFV